MLKNQIVHQLCLPWNIDTMPLSYLSVWLSVEKLILVWILWFIKCKLLYIYIFCIYFKFYYILWIEGELMYLFEYCSKDYSMFTFTSFVNQTWFMTNIYSDLINRFLLFLSFWPGNVSAPSIFLNRINWFWTIYINYFMYF